MRDVSLSALYQVYRTAGCGFLCWCLNFRGTGLYLICIEEVNVLKRDAALLVPGVVRGVLS